MHARRAMRTVALALFCAFFFMGLGLVVDLCFYNMFAPFVVFFWPSEPTWWPISFTWVAGPIGFVSGLFLQAIRRVPCSHREAA